MPDEDRERRLDELFGEYLEAIDQGVDREEELLARAGELAEDLRARIRLERELRAMAPERATASGPNAAPQRIGRFRILGLLGKGGISVVYLAHDPDMGRRVALKVLNSESLLDKQNRAWMLNEARALAQFEHPNVVKVLEVGETGTHTYLAMELVTGPSLREVIDELARRARGEPPPPKPHAAPKPDATPKADPTAIAESLRPFSARVAVLRQLADALATCHDQGVLHRDIKPHNVLFDALGTPKLIDFGLAHDERADEDSRIGLTQNLVGTAAYLAPEQVSGNETGADPRSDQFSFGIVAYELCALTNPFQKGSQRLTMAAIETADPPSIRSQVPAIPNDLALVIHHALDREPAARYADLRALERDLAALLEHRPVTVEEPSLAHVARLWVRRHRRGVTIATAALALTLLSVTALLFFASVTERTSILAELETIDPARFERPAEFEPAYKALVRLRERALDSEQRLWGRIGTQSPVLAATKAAETWSKRLGACFEEDSRDSVVAENMYRRLFVLDENLCPEAEWNERYRARGRVNYGFPETLEPTLQVLETRITSDGQHHPDDCYSVGLSTPLDPYLVPGIYRLFLSLPESDRIEAETSFIMQFGWPEEIRLSIRPPMPRYFETTLKIPRSVRNAGAASVEVPAFRITPTLVTISEFDSFLAETESSFQRWNPTDAMPDDPVFTSSLAAIAFTQWVGGRLPQLHELLTVRQAAGFRRVERAAGELLLDPATLKKVTLTSYLEYDDLENSELKSLLILPTPDVRSPVLTKTSGMGFRVTFSVDSLTRYR